MQKLVNNAAAAYQNRPALQDTLLRNAALSVPAQSLIAAIMGIARQSLNASASSILFSEEKDQRLTFIFADGSLAEQVKRLRISKNSGIAGRVATSGEALVVNNVYENRYFNRFTDEVTGNTTRSIICVPLVIADKVIGVIEVLNKLDGSGFSEPDLRTLTAIAPHVAQVIENILRTRSRFTTHRIAVNMLLSATDARETCLRGHSKRVSEYALTGATALPISNDGRQAVQYAAILHDIGKLGLSDSMLSKSDNLTGEESTIMRQYPITGFNLLRGISFLQAAAKSVLYHHERYDGSGYPKRLKGDVIPIGARLIAVADAFDTLTAEQCGRTALSRKDALTELARYSGSQFDPVVVKAFSSAVDGSI